MSLRLRDLQQILGKFTDGNKIFADFVRLAKMLLDFHKKC